MVKCEHAPMEITDLPDDIVFDKQTEVRLLTKDEVAEILGVSSRCVHRWMNRKEIPFFKVGRFPRFSPVDLNKWLEGLRVA